jgi:uncharacterized protein (TIGR03437 family)
VLITPLNISTFGEDEAGEVYVADGPGGAVYRIEGSLAPRLQAGSVVNPASLTPGMAPGSLATVFVAGIREDAGETVADTLPLPAVLAGVSVTVAGMPAPIYSVTNRDGQERLTFLVPSSLAGRATAEVVVTRDGRASAAVTVPVMAVQPAIFTTDGVRAAVVHGADFTLADASHPLVPGEVAVLYAAGMGPAVNAPPDGMPAPYAPLAAAVEPARLTIGDASADILHAGLAPGFIGVYQVIFRVPAAAGGGSRDAVLSAGTESSPPARVTVR